MIVYGDHREIADPTELLNALDRRRIDVAVMAPGLARHGALVGLLIDLGMLVQGIADARFDECGRDSRCGAEQAGLTLLRTVAAAVVSSWHAGFAEAGALPELRLDTPLPPMVSLRLPEGYAFYAVYPESFAAAANELKLEPPIRVIGLRSIGTSLAAVAAEALDAESLWTVRPTGHPFARTLALADEVAEGLLSGDASYVIVDEGPGLSGSSFGAVADFLEDHGVPRTRIVFLPSHGGDLGPQAADRHRQRWAETVRPTCSAEALLVPDRLAGWAGTLLGPIEGPLEDISGGGWRGWSGAREADWPAVDPAQERLKYLARAGGRRWLVKYAGLGEIGARKLARARMLHAAGFAAEPAGLLHGFLVEQWVEAPTVEGCEPQLLQFAARYLGFRTRMFPAPADSGASLHALLDMARFNAASVLGERCAAGLDWWRDQLAALEARQCRVEVDGRCERHEWLRLGGGRYLKTDALDHHAAHDLVGCQDIAWDVAGFSVEFDLAEDAREILLAGVVAAGGRPVDRTLLAFLTDCYLAFRIGQRDMTAAGLDRWPEEKRRNVAARDQYAARLHRRSMLSGAPGGT